MGLMALVSGTIYAAHVTMNNKQKRTFAQNRIEMMKGLLKAKHDELAQAKKTFRKDQSGSLAVRKSNLEKAIAQLETDIKVAQQSKKGLS